MEKFKTREEAEKVKAQLGKKPLGFCPVIAAVCQIDCVCYVERPPHRDRDVWRLYPDYCDHVLVSSCITVES